MDIVENIKPIAVERTVAESTTLNVGMIVGIACGVSGLIFIAVVSLVILYIFGSMICCFKLRTKIGPKQQLQHKSVKAIE